MSEIRMLTVRQPWAWAIANGGKTIENRTRSTPYRGLVAIHAGQRYDPSAGRDPAVRAAWDAWLGQARMLGVAPWEQGGSILAVTELVGVCSVSAPQPMSFAEVNPCACGPWAQPGQHHWKLNATVPIEPLSAKGWLGLRALPPELSAEVERRWGVAMAQRVGLPS